MSKKHYIIDPGHGGLIDGIYQTAPNYKEDEPKTWKKMWIHDGVPFYEGVYNRLIADKLCAMLTLAEYDHTLLVPSNADVSLHDRVTRVNDMVRKNPDTNFVLISIHGNAAGGSVRTAKGDEVWTSKGETESDRLAANFMAGYADVTGRKVRKDTRDGDVDKEANFYILKKTICPAFLTENGFFDNPVEAAFMMTEGVDVFAKAHMAGIRKIEAHTYKY